MIDTIFSWNIRGLGRSRNRLKKLLYKYNIGLFAILEPFAAEDQMNQLGSLLNYHSFVSLMRIRVGKSGFFGMK